MAEREEFTSDLFTKGVKVREEVLGKEHVRKSLESATDFTAPIQQFVTELCWGNLWSRPGLDRRTRSIINLAMLSALNLPNEVRLHVRGALNNGLSQDEIREILLQVAVYCGVPAALESAKVAAEVFAEEALTAGRG
ncbi:carboxymuconolactone decarboxylase family protein [Bordetella sp. BOR01]|uniref:carboxymuconolactone decarboxylase family protein n=1 Tax=Bordetella sp. BOR01 TaxID=2854779 RepID=UPI001C474013|nr:carboxymuconolactone decarboxylase family protein [Bordetella sp. BOR01]MBV7481674.1 carboxymuconolactone decarboxylase family protein [Bordetella sp. BOR01]